jgi:hypothetical protein
MPHAMMSFNRVLITSETGCGDRLYILDLIIVVDAGSKPQ